MGLTMEQQKAVASQMAKRYRQASKKKKGQIIEQYMGLTACTRHHAAWRLRCWGTTVWDRHDGRLVKIVVGQRRRRRHTRRVYDRQTVAALTKLWRHFGYLCGKRLAATLRLWLWLPNYERLGRTQSPQDRAHPRDPREAAAHQPATIDRLLRAEKHMELSRFGGQVISAVRDSGRETHSRCPRPARHLPLSRQQLPLQPPQPRPHEIDKQPTMDPISRPDPCDDDVRGNLRWIFTSTCVAAAPLVTGGATGIGRAISEAFIDNGAAGPRSATAPAPSPLRS